MSFCPLVEDARHVSCKLDSRWFAEAKEKIRYEKALKERMQLQANWQYNKDDCQCIRENGDEEHDDWNECKVCGRCIANEPMLKDKYDSYEDKPYCIECVLELENCDVEDIAALFN